MNSIKFTTLLQKNSLYQSSIRPRNILKNHRLSQNTSLAHSFFTSSSTTRILPLTYNKIFLNNKSFFPSFSYSNGINNKRYFNNIFSLNFWSAKKIFKPRFSNPRNFFDSSTSINNNNATPKLSPTILSPTSPIPTPILFCNSIIDFKTTTKRNQFVLNYGGSGIPKQSETLISIKNDGKYYSIGCGEDSFFLRNDSLGVADGVGGWRNVASLHKSVVDSSLYSRKLMHYSYVELERCDNIDDERYYHYNEVNPVDILQASYEQTVKDCTSEGVIGSSTALIAILRDDELRIANIGDCSIGVIRRNDFIFRNEEQQHSFNYPYQLGTNSLDTPQNSQQFTIKIQQGDIIIMGSDGIFDNLFEEVILEEITKQNSLKVDPQIISDNLAWKAKVASKDLDNPSPFQYRAMQEGLYYQGGKRDDISVLAAVVTDNIRMDKD